MALVLSSDAIDQLADDFEKTAKHRLTLTIEEFLAERKVSLSSGLLEALLLVELDLRPAGQWSEAELERRFPEHRSAVRGALAAIAARTTDKAGVPSTRPELEPTYIPVTAIVDVDAAERMAIPKGIGAYNIKDVLGKGGMGIVYSAVHRRTSERVAIKLVLPQLQATPQALQVFLREASILTSLKHSRIVASKEFGMHENRPYFVMEYIPAVDIEEILATQSPKRRIRVVCKTMCKVLEGLQYAHDQGIVHRDVKPSNILLYWTDKKLNCKLADFGLAKRFEDAGLSGLTGDNEIRGTIAYMPPEQLRDSRFAGPLADIYAVGICLFRYLAGVLPYRFIAGEALMRCVIQHDMQRLRDVMPNVPPDLEHIVDTALKLNPADRFSSAAEMLKALRGFVDRSG